MVALCSVTSPLATAIHVVFQAYHGDKVDHVMFQACCGDKVDHV